MANYIDGFVFPIPRKHLDQYQQVAHEVSKIWKEHGALSYSEYVGEDMHLEGTLSFYDALNTKEDEIVIFGWVEFDSKESRDLANQKVANDGRISELIAPLIDPSGIIFNADRMAFGGFNCLIHI